MAKAVQLLGVGTGRRDRGGGDHADARDRREPLACLVLGMPGAELAVERADLLGQLPSRRTRIARARRA